MDLRQTYKATIEALEKEENEIVQLKQLLLDKEAVLNRREKELAEAVKQLESELRSVKDVKDVKALKEFNIQKTHDLNQTELQLKQKETSLKKYENSLYEIKIVQEQRAEKLNKQQAEVDHKEKTYKQSIMEEVSRNFANKILA